MIIPSLTVEILKLKRTLAPWVALVTPLIVTTLMFLILMRRQEPFAEPVAPWAPLESNVTAIWAMLMFPMVIALQASVIRQLEYSGNNWKHICALPVPRWALFGAKLAVNWILAALSTLILIIMIIVFGLLASVLRPDLNFVLSWPEPTLWIPPLIILLAFFPVLVIQTWVGLRFAAVVPCLVVGIMGTVSNAFINSSPWADELPWSYPQLANMHVRELISGETGSGNVEDLTSRLGVFTLAGLVCALGAGWDLLRRDIP